MKNLDIVKLKAGNFYYRRMKKINLLNDNLHSHILDLLKVTKIKPKNILELGCSTGARLNIYQEYLKPKTSYGVDLSAEAINYGKKKYKKLRLSKLSSLDIDKFKIKFDLIICGFFLDQLDRNDIFKQFDLIQKKLNNNGFLIINDFDPLFKHTNKNKHNKNLLTFKMKYDNFLEESGLFKITYKSQFIIESNNKYKSCDESIILFKKIDFKKSYPEGV